MMETKATPEQDPKAQRFAKLFRKAGVAFKAVNAFGPRVIVTCRSHDAARSVAGLLTTATFKVDAMKKSMDYDKKDKGTRLTPTMHEVWRVWAHACPGEGCVRCLPDA